MDPLLLQLPFTGRWTVQNSPANRVPSHGTHLFGTTYAIDFVAVDERGRSAPPSFRAAFGTEPPEDFTGFGVPVLAPAAGVVTAVHDGEPDHEARRSPLSLAGYALSQRERVRQGPAGIAGNHVVLAVGSGPDRAYILLAHLRRGSTAVAVGDTVLPGTQVGNCGNSGNSTEPHVHVQASDSMDWERAHGLPLAFARPGTGEPWLPRNREIFDAG
ncbi:M23 family metallopeptidase [Arthrobacter sp. zg-Y916]|uniref:M23 family metallopeptidase n=1 Tax=Arthrobacter caoxuetaonis TaxID=2886935 RepID=A0A9X1SEY3_9MICC|nr:MULTISPECIES: M23 family metallopeptidase [Arthrobacter]MCC3298124.1 M23 family metallopeptidase [Arthrobacter caoxuetaonis]MCC9192079.1 M23 family metallopeptidase [Arthrobacter sp. zg-Y916]USQ57131.1 M23 family metallopeptidase [Arthrobacter caoxuetaonis]